jgi:UDP-glucuronate decarboxylase
MIRFRTVNIGNPHEFTMLELAQAVIELTGSNSKIIHMPLPQDDPKQSSLIFHWLKRNYKDGSQKYS